MALTGDWARLQATIRGLSKLAALPSRVAKYAAPEIKAEIKKSFATSTDPYGHRWAPHASETVRRWGKHPILRLTGAGASEIDVRAMSGAGISVTSPSEGLAFAQAGTVNEPRRRFLPDDQMPKTWRRIIERSAEKAAREAMRDAG